LQAIKEIPSNNNSSKDRLTRQNSPVTYAFNSLADKSKEHYTEKLKDFFDSIPGLEGNNSTLDEQGLAFLAKAKQEVNDNDNKYWIEDCMEDYLQSQKKRVEKGEIGENTPSDYYWPIKRFCDRHKRNLPTIDIEWDRLYDIVERKSTHSEDDRPYTVAEIHKVIKNPNRRVKPIVLVMCSSGIRLGSWMYLKWKHVIPITNADYLRLKKQEENEKPLPDQRNSDIINIPITADDENKVIAAKLTAYDTKRRRWYNTFITPEAYFALKDWMDFRSNVQHEDINGESWL
jgi:integrase